MLTTDAASVGGGTGVGGPCATAVDRPKGDTAAVGAEGWTHESREFDGRGARDANGDGLGCDDSGTGGAPLGGATAAWWPWGGVHDGRPGRSPRTGPEYMAKGV